MVQVLTTTFLIVWDSSGTLVVGATIFPPTSGVTVTPEGPRFRPVMSVKSGLLLLPGAVDCPPTATVETATTVGAGLVAAAIVETTGTIPGQCYYTQAHAGCV